MYRVLLTVGVGLFALSAVRADLGPPKGAKIVPVDHKFTTEKEYPDYLFFTISGGKGIRAKLTEVKLDPKTPALFPGAGRTGVGRIGTFVAVPKDAAKNYDTEAKFHDAIKNQTIEGMLKTTTKLDSQTTIKDTDKRTVVVREHAITKIDAKDGIVLDAKKDGSVPEKRDGTKKDSPEADGNAPEVPTSTPRGGAWVAGGATALAVMLGGLWVVRLGRRKV